MTETRHVITERLKTALLARDSVTVGTLRLILAALKDRDIAARGKGHPEGVEEADVLALLQSMVKQRLESIAAYRAGGREDLASREEAEITIIQSFLPQQIGGADLGNAVEDAIAVLAATSIKDMGRVMALLREKYPGQVDAKTASILVREKLGG